MHETGIASAIDEGIKSAKGELVSWMDSDRSHQAKYLPSMIEKLRSGYDVVIASRYVKGGRDERSATRIITSYFFNMYAYLILGKVKDYDSGFIVMKKSIFDTVKFSTKVYGDYFIELVYKCTRKGFKVAEVPFANPDRIYGTSKTADNIFTLLKYGIKYGIRVIKIKMRF